MPGLNTERSNDQLIMINEDDLFPNKQKKTDQQSPFQGMVFNAKGRLVPKGQEDDVKQRTVGERSIIGDVVSSTGHGIMYATELGGHGLQSLGMEEVGTNIVDWSKDFVKKHKILWREEDAAKGEE